MSETPYLPPRADRVAARSALLAFSVRRQRSGSGSDLEHLMNAPRSSPSWWSEIGDLLRRAGIEFAVAGAVAANNYMPPRMTADFDLAMRLVDLERAGETVKAGGWQFLRDLALYDGFEGTAWEHHDGHELDLLGLPGKLGDEAISSAQSNLRDGLPMLTLPYLVTLKLIAARVTDTADISRMLGRAKEDEIERVRAVVRRHRPEDAPELDQMVELGRLEYQTEAAPPEPPGPGGGLPLLATETDARPSPTSKSGVRCRICKRPLSDPASVARGMGDDCASVQSRSGQRE